MKLPFRESHTTPMLFLLAIAVIASTYFVDIHTPPGTAAGVIPYFFAIFITVASRNYWLPFIAAALALTALFVSLADVNPDLFRPLVGNRLLVGVALVAAAVLVHLRQRSVRTLMERKRDLEQQVAARTASLEEAMQRLSLAKDSLGLGIWEWDSATDTLAYDQRMYELYGRSDLYGKVTARELLDTVIGAELHEKLRQESMATMRAHDTYYQRLVVSWPDGSQHYLESHAVLHRNPSNALEHVIGVTQDVTEREDVERLARRSQRLEAVGQLTGGIAHDFNNLLTAVQNSLDLLEDVARSDPASIQALRIANRAAERGAELTQRLLAFSRNLDLVPSRVDVSGLIEEFSEFLRRTLGEHVKIKLQLTPDLPPVIVDAGQLENALLNLAINARDAMPDGGLITISTQLTDISGRPGAAPGPHVNIRLTDTGTGMAPGIVEHAFEPYFTTKDVGKGSGLGLSMVYGFVKQSGGFVDLDSTLGKGTSIDLHFPVAKDAVAEAGSAEDCAAKSAEIADVKKHAGIGQQTANGE